MLLTLQPCKVNTGFPPYCNSIVFLLAHKYTTWSPIPQLKYCHTKYLFTTPDILLSYQVNYCHTRYCCHRCQRKLLPFCCIWSEKTIAVESYQLIAAKADQRKCCTAVLTNRNVALRSKLPKNLLMCMITVGEAAEKLRRTISSNKDF